MPSSTFSSEQDLEAAVVAGKREIAILLAIIVGFLILLEMFTWLVIEKRSKVEQTTNREYQEAIAIRRSRSSGPKQLLVVGNSLVGIDVDMALLGRELGSNWQVHRFWIHNTTFEDWRYGLERLFAEGSRPDAVCLVLAAMHWRATGIRGDYSAPYLFRAIDIPRLGNEIGYDRTQTSDLAFAKLSRFYAVRAEIRKQALQFLIPDLADTYKLIRPGASKPETSADVLESVRPRMKELEAIANRYETAVIVAVPPVPRPGAEWHDELRLAAHEAGVHIEMPMSYANTPAQDFVDDVHLSPSGATLFTTRLAGGLRQSLDEPLDALAGPH